MKKLLVFIVLSGCGNEVMHYTPCGMQIDLRESNWTGEAFDKTESIILDEFSKRGVGGVSRGETCTSLRLTHFVFRPVLFFQPEDGCGTVIEDFNPAVALPHPLAHCLLRNGSSHDGWTWEDDGVFTAVYSVKYRHAEVGGFH